VRAEVQLYTLFNFGDRRGGWFTPHPGRFTAEIDPVAIVQEPGWDPEPVCKGTENLVATGIGSPDRPACGESLYRLSYPAPRI
jgi:hypothetical protein